MNDTLIIDGININQSKNNDFIDVCINNSKYKMLVLNNSTIQNKVLIFENDNLIITLDITENHPFFKQYEINKLIKIDNISLIKDNKKII